MSSSAAPTAAAAIGFARVGLGLGTIGVLLFTFFSGGGTNGLNPFDFFGYFTNLTSLVTAGILILTGVHTLSGRPVPHWLVLSRAVATACMIIVAVVYNVLVPGTGSAPAWVSVTLHLIVPALALLDWLLIGDRPPLPCSRLWVVLPYPVLWVTVVLVRGATDGWVPYGFLLPERGVVSMVLHVAGLLAALMVAGMLVWWGSRVRGLRVR